MTYVEVSVENPGQVNDVIKMCIQDVIHCMESGKYGPYEAPKYF
jgi:hypothetical protein